MKVFWRRFLKTLIIITSILGVVFLFLIILALTPAPFYMHYKLGIDPNKSEEAFFPDRIVMLGGGGMPSEDNLMRLYYTAEFANYYQVPVTILHPEDSVVQAKMMKELSSKGLNSDSILFFTKGTNTRAQILSLKDSLPEYLDCNLLIVTSPDHLTRAIKCFNKLDFKQIRGQAAFAAVINFDLSLEEKELLGNKYIPEVSNVQIRYTFWNYLKLETACFREYFALAYYKAKRWI